MRSVADSLEPHCSSMNVPEAPFVLHLPNVMHLATDVAGVVHDSATVSSLQLAASLHPSAAVGGTPTGDAVRLIAEIEGMDRGRFAGPVGWMDTAGDGEWAIALRSAQLDGATVRLWTTQFNDRLGPLRRGEVDLTVTRLPLEQPDIEIGPLLSEGDARVLMVAADHPLAARDEASVEDLADWPVPGPALAPSNGHGGRPGPLARTEP